MNDVRLLVGDLAAAIGASLRGDRAVAVLGVQQDSRRVEPGDLFAALCGARVDGLSFARAAVDRGAAAILCAAGRGAEVAELGAPVLEVGALRPALARAAALVYGDPTRSLAVVGITGTNGKTTTAHLVEAALSACGHRPGIVGTLGYRLGEQRLAGHVGDAPSHTSPEADELQRIAARMLASGASHLVMEVSSIALATDRVAEVRFAVAAFTNLTHDHLDFHGSMAAYGQAKERLFFDFAPQVSVVNVDGEHGEGLADRLRAAGREVIAVSERRDSRADVRAAATLADRSGTTIHLADGAIVRSPLCGAHNAQNLLLAIGIARALGLPDERALPAIGAVRGVSGRLERCDDPALDEIVALVDYAHTPDALSRVLASVRPLCAGRLWCVFGCGGDRDPHKRPLMGEAVARGADAIVVTNDNPRGEKPEDIAAAIVTGLSRAGAVGAAAQRAAGEAKGPSYAVELDRAKAIERAILGAAPGEVVVVAGKGHEPYQIIGDRVLAFDDREAVRAALEKRRTASPALADDRGGSEE